MALRKALSDEGLDAGPHTIQFHLSRRRRRGVPSVTTIWRVLQRRGFVTPQPHKRPRSSYVRFEADLPHECWQADTTHWALADGADVEILNMIDDHFRLRVGSQAVRTTKAADVVATFYGAAGRFGLPASLLTDNGAVFTAAPRGGRCVIETELDHLGITSKHSRPYHPQTCGKVERFHQTLKRWLAKPPPPATLADLQAQLDHFAAYYNTVRPHRALRRQTPSQAFAARTKATPRRPGVSIPTPYRVRHDRIDSCGRIDVRVLTEEGELLRHLTLDPSRDYQPHERP